MGGYVLDDLGHVLVCLLVDPHLLVHVEDRKIVVDHQDAVDVVVVQTLVCSIFVPPFSDIHRSVSECDDRENVRSLELRLLDEFPHDHRDSSCIVRENEADLVCFIHRVALFQLLRNAQRSIRQLFRDEKRIAGSREIEYDSLLVLCAVLENRCMCAWSYVHHDCRGQSRSHDLKCISSVHVWVF